MLTEFEWSARSLDDRLVGWRRLLSDAWPAYEAWWLQDGDAARPPLDLCRAALDRHMHEIVPLWERLCDDATARQKRFLSFWSPPPYITGCSQAAVVSPRPALVRNYDYEADAFDCLLLKTEWLGRRVLGVSDGLWGLLDGMNDAGLCVSLAFGGRRQIGPGFGIPLIVRYVLQIAETADEAVRLLARLPSHMSYNVTVLDRHDRIATVALSPDRAPEVRETGLATNHQRDVPDWPEHARLTATTERLAHLTELVERGTGGDDLVEQFLLPPLHVRGFTRGFGTLYTAAYRPREGNMSLSWPGLSRRVALDDEPVWDLTVRLAGEGEPARGTDRAAC